MENPEQVGLPFQRSAVLAMKNVNPCTVKPVKCKKNNTNWVKVSPDENFSTEKQVRNKSEKKEKKYKKANKESRDKSASSKTCKSQSHCFGKLDFLSGKESKLGFDSDDNKENIKPGSIVASSQDPVEKQADTIGRTKNAFTGKSNRVNIL